MLRVEWCVGTAAFAGVYSAGLAPREPLEEVSVLRVVLGRLWSELELARPWLERSVVVFMPRTQCQTQRGESLAFVWRCRFGG